MDKVLYGLLLLTLAGWVIEAFREWTTQPVLLLLSLLVNGAIFWALWKGVSFYTKHKPKPFSKRQLLGRALVLFFFSITATEWGMVLSYLVRLFIDQGLANRTPLALSLYRLIGNNYTILTYVLGVLISYPLYFFFAKALRHSRPHRAAVSLCLVWLLLILGLNSLIPGSF